MTVTPQSRSKNLEARALDIVARHPRTFTRSSLAEALPFRKKEAMDAINRLIATGELTPTSYSRRAHLFVSSKGLGTLTGDESGMG